VEGVGDSVEGSEIGDRTFRTGLQTHRQGSYVEYVVAPEQKVATLPTDVSFETGAGAGLIGTTAWLGFQTHRSLSPTSFCLVHGSSGGVGHGAVQVAKACGATIVATAGRDRTLEFCEESGQTPYLILPPRSLTAPYGVPPTVRST
jgi:NADPH2:quinone reductase